MSFTMKHNIFAEARAVLDLKSPLKTFKPEDIGTFVLAYSDIHTCVTVPGTLTGFGCDEDGEYATVQPFTGGSSLRYEYVVPMPAECLPTGKTEIENTVWRDPNITPPKEMV